MLTGQLSLIVAALFAGAGDRQQDSCRGNESGKQVHGRYSPMVGAAFSCAAPGSRELNIMVLERERADPFTRRIEEGH